VGDVPNENVLDKLRIEVYTRINRVKDMGECKVGFSVLETTFFALGHSRADGRYDNDIVVVLFEASVTQRRWLSCHYES
jgi:hypothetical protein